MYVIVIDRIIKTSFGWLLCYPGSYRVSSYDVNHLRSNRYKNYFWQIFTL